LPSRNSLSNLWIQKVIIDHREKGCGVPRILRNLAVPFEFKQLTVGDYIIQGVGIERKTIHDYLTSILDGRISRQLYLLSSTFPLSYLIVEGYITEALMERKFKRSAFIGSLVSASLKKSSQGAKGQVIVVTLENYYDTALFIKFLYDKLRRADTIRYPPKSRVKVHTAFEVLTSLPFVGEILARKLLRRYRNLKGIANAPKHELQLILGKKRGERLYELFNEEWGL